MVDAKDSLRTEPKSSTTTTSDSQSHSQQQRHTNILMALICLRIIVIILTAAAIVVTVTNHQTVTLFSFKFEAHFYYSSSFKFFVAANAVVCLVTVMTLISSYLMRNLTPQRRDFYFLLFVFDLLMTVLLLAGVSAATAVGYVGQFGEEHMGWSSICNHVQKFCKTNLISLLLSYLAFFANLGLTILMAYYCTYLMIYLI